MQLNPQIYVLIDGQPHGPYTPELIRQYLASGQFQPSQLAAPAGSADWQPLSVLAVSWNKPASPAPKIHAPGSKGSKRPRIRRVMSMLAILILLIAGGAGFFWWRQFGGIGPVVKVTTPAEPGLPNTWAELNNSYKEPPPGRNAATIVMKAFEAMKMTSEDQGSPGLPIIGKGKLPALGDPMPAATKTRITLFTARNQNAWSILRGCIGLEHARYPVDLNQGYGTLLPHLRMAKSGSNLGALNALLHAEAKQGHPAADALLASLAIAQSLKAEPLVISQALRSRQLMLVRETLETVLNWAALPPADLDQLSEVFAQAETEEADGMPFTRAWVGERACALGELDLPLPELRKSLEYALGPGFQVPGAGPRPVGFNDLVRNLKSQRAFAEETFNRALLMRKQPFPGRLTTDDYVAARAAEAQTNRFFLPAMLLPALDKVADREARGLAALRLARTAVALEQFRLQNGGAYPAGLSDLLPRFLPAVPGDPFAARPLAYFKSGKGYILYTVGKDLDKDAGKAFPADDRALAAEIAKAQRIQVITPK